MANFVNLMQGTREVIINKDFIIKVSFYSHNAEQNVLAITFAHNVEFPFCAEGERDYKQMRFYFDKPNKVDTSNRSKLYHFTMALNRKEMGTIFLEDFFAPRNQQQANPKKESK